MTAPVYLPFFNSALILFLIGAVLYLYNRGRGTREQIIDAIAKAAESEALLGQIRAERRTMWAESLLSAITEEMQSAFILANDAERILSWNPAAVKLFGWTEGEALEKTIDIIIPESLRSQHHFAFKDVMKGERPAKYENKVLNFNALHKDGYEFPVEITIIVLPKDGKRCAATLIRKIA